VVLREHNGASATVAQQHSGDYALLLSGEGAYATALSLFLDPPVWDPKSSEIYLSLWYRSVDTDSITNNRIQIKIMSADGYGVEFKLDNHWDAYTFWGLAASGTVGTVSETWSRFQAHIKLHVSNGIIETMVDDTPDIIYTGPTHPFGYPGFSGYYVQNVGLYYDYATGGIYADDWLIGVDGWPDDIRFDAALVPNGDEWKGTNWHHSEGEWDDPCYVMIDEIPPSIADYVYYDPMTLYFPETWPQRYDLADWGGEGKSPSFLVQWYYGAANYDPYYSSPLQLLAKLGSFTTYKHLWQPPLCWWDPFGVPCVPGSRYQLMTERPGGGAWTHQDISDLVIGEVVSPPSSLESHEIYQMVVEVGWVPTPAQIYVHDVQMGARQEGSKIYTQGTQLGDVATGTIYAYGVQMNA